MLFRAFVYVFVYRLFAVAWFISHKRGNDFNTDILAIGPYKGPEISGITANQDRPSILRLPNHPGGKSYQISITESKTRWRLGEWGTTFISGGEQLAKVNTDTYRRARQAKKERL